MKHSSTHKHLALVRRHRRARATISGQPARPRLAVFRSLKHVSAQLIDDTTGTTLVGVSEKELTSAKGTKSERAAALGTLLAAKAKTKNITTVVFDRAGYRYHGRIKALAEAARNGGLIF